MDGLGVRNNSNKKAKKPIKVVYIANPKMVKASAADFRALVQELTGNTDASSDRTLTAPPPISSPDENDMIRPSQVAEVMCPGVLINSEAETMGRDLSLDSPDSYATELPLEDLTLQQIMLEGSTVFEIHSPFTSELVNYEPFGVGWY